MVKSTNTVSYDSSFTLPLPADLDRLVKSYIPCAEKVATELKQIGYWDGSTDLGILDVRYLVKVLEEHVSVPFAWAHNNKISLFRGKTGGNCYPSVVIKTEGNNISVVQGSLYMTWDSLSRTRLSIHGLEEDIKQACLDIGKLQYMNAVHKVANTPYSFQDASVRHRRAYKALLNYLQHRFHSLKGHTNAEKERMLFALKLIPKKKVDPSADFRFSIPDREFIAAAHQVIQVETVTKIEEKRVPVRKALTRKVRRPVAIRTDTLGEKPLKGFKVAKMVEKIMESTIMDRPSWRRYDTYPETDDDYNEVPSIPGPLFQKMKQDQEFNKMYDLYKGPMRREEFYYEHHIALAMRKDSYKKFLDKWLRETFPEFADKPITYETVIEKTGEYKNFGFKTVQYETQDLVEVLKWEHLPKKMEIRNFKCVDKWADEMVELSYMPGYSVIRSEFLPYRDINKKTRMNLKDDLRKEKKKKKKKKRIEDDPNNPWPSKFIRFRLMPEVSKDKNFRKNNNRDLSKILRKLMDEVVHDDK